MSFSYRSAPAGKVIGILSLCELHRRFQAAVEISIDIFALYPSTQKIGPKKFAKRGRILRKSARLSQFSGQASEGIIDKIRHGFRDFVVITPATLVVKRMHPAAIVENDPKGFLIKLAEICNDGHKHVVDAFLMKCQSEMVVINSVMAALRSKDHGDHVFAKKFGTSVLALLAPMLSLGSDLAHTHGYLGGANL